MPDTLRRYESVIRQLGAKHAYNKQPPEYPEWPEYMAGYNATKK